MRARRVEATRRARPGAEEAQNRRERRHPETIAAAEETPDTEAATGTETGPETEETTSAEQALLSEVANEEADEADGAEGQMRVGPRARPPPA